MRGGSSLQKCRKIAVQKMTRPAAILAGFLSLSGLACAVATGIVDPNAASTAVAQTIVAGQTSTAAVLSAAGTLAASLVPAATSTPEATATPEFSATPSATPTSTETPTPSVPLAALTQNTNCRSGPLAVYDLIRTFLTGEMAQITGKDAAGDYWYVTDPGQPGKDCWLWGRYVTVSGDTSNVPVFTPPPTPTPSLGFTLSYSYMEAGCPFGFAPGFQVVNTGSVTFKSGKIKAEDTVQNETVENSTDVFDKRSGCVGVDTSIPDLDPGDTGYIYGNSFSDPFGHEMQVTVTLCTGPGQTGQCVSKTLNFTIP